MEPFKSTTLTTLPYKIALDDLSQTGLVLHFHSTIKTTHMTHPTFLLDLVEINCNFGKKKFHGNFDALYKNL
jgi:hypothetical protein